MEAIPYGGFNCQAGLRNFLLHNLLPREHLTTAEGLKQLLGIAFMTAGLQHSEEQRENTRDWQGVIPYFWLVHTGTVFVPLRFLLSLLSFIIYHLKLCHSLNI